MFEKSPLFLQESYNWFLLEGTIVVLSQKFDIVMEIIVSALDVTIPTVCSWCASTETAVP
jgi:hypothetical protein